MSNLSWRTKLMGLFTLVLGASLLFQVFYVLPTIQNQQVEMAQSQQEGIAHHIARELDTDLSRRREELKAIAGFAEFRNMDLVNQTQIMKTIANVLTRYSSFFVMDTEGWFVSGSVENLSPYQEKSYAYEPFFSVPFEQGEVHFAPPRLLSQLGVITSVSVPIESDTGERVGVLRGGMLLKDLIESVANYPLAEETVAFLVDNEGTVVAHSGIDLSALEEGPLSLNFSDRPLVQAIMAGEVGEAGEYEHEGTPYFGSYVILETNGWGVVVETPMSVILAESNVLAGRLLSVNVVLFVIALAVSLVFTQQITAERKRVEQALQESEQWLSTTLRSIGDAVIATDAQGLVTLVNPVAEDLTGWDEAEAADRPLEEVFNIVNEQTGERAENPVVRALREGVVVGLANHTVLIAKDGTKRPIDDSGAPMRDEEGNIIGTVMVFRDITERRRAEEELRIKDNAITTSISAIAMSDLEGNVTYVNPSFLKLWGYDDEKEVLGKSVAEFWQRGEKALEVVEALRDKGSWIGELVAVREDGSFFYVQLLASMVTDEAGKPMCMMASFVDITERKRAEEELAQRVQELETFNRLAVGREQRMIELKRQVNQLSEQLGKEPPYDLSLLE